MINNPVGLQIQVDITELELMNLDLQEANITRRRSPIKVAVSLEEAMHGEAVQHLGRNGTSVRRKIILERCAETSKYKKQRELLHQQTISLDL